MVRELIISETRRCGLNPIYLHTYGPAPTLILSCRLQRNVLCQIGKDIHFRSIVREIAEVKRFHSVLIHHAVSFQFLHE